MAFILNAIVAFSVWKGAGMTPLITITIIARSRLRILPELMLTHSSEKGLN
jgi:hypothetical protein